MRILRVAAALTAVGVAGTFTASYFLMATVVGQSTGSDAYGASGSCVAVVNNPSGRTELDEEQLTNAKTIAEVGATLSVPVRGLVIAEATALQESYLHNLHYGDRDSVGLFQQRPSSGWGTVSELTTPEIAAEKFYQALVKVPGWQGMALTRAAQAVQRSAYPTAYAKWEPLAQSLIDSMVGQNGEAALIDCGSNVGAGLPSGAVGDMLNIAVAQRGEPYVWGATGPDAFDCSGLVVYSWRRAGYPLAVRTSEQMYGVSTVIPAGQEQPGDLLFGHFNSNGPGHVMIVIEPGVAIEAPHTGDVVKIVDYDPEGWTIGRLNAEAFVGDAPG
jgi:cell wall-associated NlpC family hydrolase